MVERVFVQGNEAVVEGAMYAGCHRISIAKAPIQTFIGKTAVGKLHRQFKLKRISNSCKVSYRLRVNLYIVFYTIRYIAGAGIGNG